MKAIKFIDCAGNVSYVKGNSFSVGKSLVKANIGDKPYNGQITSMFFLNYSDLQKWLEMNQNKILIGKGCMTTGLADGNSRANHIYEITLL